MQKIDGACVLSARKTYVTGLAHCAQQPRRILCHHGCRLGGICIPKARNCDSGCVAMSRKNLLVYNLAAMRSNSEQLPPSTAHTKNSLHMPGVISTSALRFVYVSLCAQNAPVLLTS